MHNKMVECNPCEPATPATPTAPAVVPVSNPTAGDDTTQIRVAPVSVPGDQSDVRLVGLFFNQNQIREEDEPESGLTIEKDVLDRSTGEIFGRFRFDNLGARGKIIFRVFLDGKEIKIGGANLPYGKFKGYYDTNLFRYPNTANSNTDGIHRLKVVSGVITGGVDGNTKGRNEGLGLLDFGQIRSVKEADFTIKLLPHKIPQD